MIKISLEHDWLDILATVAIPVLVGLFVAWTAYRQMNTDRNRLRLELLERRLQIFTLLRDAGIEITMHNRPTDELLGKMLNVIPESEFLFGKELSEFCMQALHDCSRLNWITPKISNEIHSPQRKGLLAEQEQITGRLLVELGSKDLLARFSREMRINER